MPDSRDLALAHFALDVVDLTQERNAYRELAQEACHALASLTTKHQRLTDLHRELLTGQRGETESEADEA